MRLYAAVIYFFLYAPIAMLVLFSFSSGRQASTFEGFSLQWYGKAAGNSFVIDAVGNSLSIAAASGLLGALFGTMAALALQRLAGWRRAIYDAVILVALMIPGIVIGLSSLVMLATLFNIANDMLQGLSANAPRLQLGWTSIVAAHALFNIALVIVIVRARLAGMDRSLMEASADLYATPWGTFRQVTLPLIAPAVIAGFLLSFTFSFDDYIVASFVNGSTVTLPLFIFNSIRRGLTPEVNVIATVVLTTSLIMLFTAQFLLRRARPQPAANAA